MQACEGSFPVAAEFDLGGTCRGSERAVYNPFFSSMMLAVEAQRVVELRLVRLAWGGKEGLAEAQSMVTEKVHAAGEAMTTLMLGGSPETVIARYREHVAANTKRLSATKLVAP
jgi:hypothetical protein